jgi:uncharacterized membrane protein
MRLKQSKTAARAQGNSCSSKIGLECGGMTLLSTTRHVASFQSADMSAHSKVTSTHGSPTYAQKFLNFQILPARRFPTLSGIQMPLPEHTRKYFFWTLNALLGVAFVVELLVPGYLSWIDAATIALAAIASIFALNRQLPLQNVLPAALITAVVGGAVHGLSARTAIPFGPVVFNSQAGFQIFDLLPWTVPFIWIVAIFNARGVGRLILRPWRKVRNYGYWLIGLTALLAVAFDFALEPFAWHVKHLWLWQPTKLAVNWHGASPLNFLGWGGVSLFILMFITPSLIKKQPGSASKPDFHPLAVWLGALLIFATGAAGAGLWWSVGADAAIAAVTTVFAVRGAKW